MLSIIVIVIVGAILYFAASFVVGMLMILACAFLLVLSGPVAIASTGDSGAAFAGLCAFGLVVWFLIAVLKPSPEGKRSSNPFD